jgi:signal transduction histidine kinase
MNQKAEATAAIARAQGELDTALARMATLPTLDADRLSYAVHALNNYLMVVSTIAHILRATIGKTAALEVQDRFEALNHATLLMKQLVRQLVFPANDEKPHLIFLPVDLVPILGSCCDEYDPLARAKNISIVREPSSLPITAWADRVAVVAILDNLLSNAVKYSFRDGTIRVRVYQNADEGIFSISDSGPGIPENESQHLFTRGGTLSSRPTAGEESTGYGLAIARDLVDAMGGRIWFHNETGGGATFSFAVPRYDPTRHGTREQVR